MSQSIHEDCCGCIEFYHGCHAQPEGKAFKCADYRRLPDVMPGVPLPPFPPSKMQGRIEPRIRTEPAAEQERPAPRRRAVAQPQSGPMPSVTPRAPRRQSPVAQVGPDGERLCQCGAKLGKKKRCCVDCRSKRRVESLHGRKRTSLAVDAGSGVPTTCPGTLSTCARIAAHN